MSNKQPNIETNAKTENVVTETSAQSLVALLFGSPINTVLTIIIAFLIYRLIRGRTRRNTSMSSFDRIFIEFCLKIV